MANEFKVKNGLIVIGDLTTSGTITINGALAATQSWVTSQAYLTSASLSGYATQSYVTSAIAALVDSAPAALNTLNELAAALGDDANFSTTITNSIASKQAQLNGTGFVKVSGTTVSYDNSTYLTSYTETDTLATVTGRGATTTSAVTVGTSLSITGPNRTVSMTSSSNYLHIQAYAGSTNGAQLWLGNDNDPGFYVNASQHFFRGLDSSNKMYINGTSGNIGIGTTSPLYKLDVNGSIRSGSANQSALLVQASGTATTQAAIAIQQLTSEGDTIIFADYEPYAEYGIIARNSLDSIDFTGGTTGGSLESYSVTNRTGNTRTAYAKARIALATGNSFFGGNVGIGTLTPNSKLDVRGVIESSDGTIRTVLSYTGAGGVTGTITNHHYIFYTNNGERARITTGGNVLIGTTSDSGHKLNVNGTAYIGGAATLNSSLAVAGNTSTPQITARRYFQNPDGVPTNNLGDPTVTEMALFDEQFDNKTAFYPFVYGSSILTFETYDGTTWTDITSTLTDTQKKQLFGGDNNSSIAIPYGTVQYQITINNPGPYVYLNALYNYWSANGHNTRVNIWKKHNSGSWVQHTNSTTTVASWPGHLYLPFSTIPWHPAGTLGTHYNQIRVVYTPNWNSSYPTNNISLLKFQMWGGYPASKRVIYSTDENRNVTFSNNLTASGSLISTGSFTANSSSTFAQLATFNNGISSRSATPTITLDRNSSYSWRFIVGDGGTYPTSTLNVVNNGGTAITTFLDGGNVGIGTTSPSYKLDVNGGPIRITNGFSEPTSEDGYRIKFADNGGINNDSGIGLSGALGSESLWINKGSANGNIRFMFGTLGEKVTFTSSGEVGIGTTTPVRKIDVLGGAFFGSTSGAIEIGNSGYLGYISGHNGLAISTNHLNVGLTSGEKVRITSAGDVGIGTSTPNAKLELSVGAGVTGGLRINYAASATGEGMDITYLNNGTTTTSFDSRYNSDSAVMQFRMKTAASAITAMTILGSGNIGIGTTSPLFKTTISADITKSGDINPGTAQLSLEGATTPGKRMILGYDTNSNGFGFIKAGNYGVTWTALSLQPDGGNVGIGTVSPSTKLDVVGVITATGGNSTNWNTAYGWGNHSGLYASLAHTHSATDITSGTLASARLSGSYAIDISGASSTSNTLTREDNRTISPSELAAGQLKFGFTSWANNGGNPYADFLHLRSYTDASGGNDNLVMFRKDAIGMRIWQQTWGSTTAYASYVDVWTTANFTQTNVNNWNTSYGWGNHASAGYLTSVTAHTQAWSTITSTPTTISGYGITNAYTDTQIQNFFNGANAISGYNKSNWDTAYGWGNHASSGYIVAGSTISDTGSWTNATKFKSSGDIANSAAGNHSLQIFSDTNNDAFIAFHISGDHAVYFGLENATNRLHTGGWSDGANKYQLWDSRDFTSSNISSWNTSYGWGNHASAGYATTSYVTTQINNLVAGAPGVLDTLDELAAALGDDSNFATTVTNSIATKLPLAGGTMSGTILFVNDVGTALQGTVGINDFWRIYANSTSTNAGYLEIATSDDGTEPIYVRQYTGVFSNLTRTATLLDGTGNTSFPGNLNIGGFLTESSSLKLKENIEISEGNLEKVVNLRPVTYNKIGSQTTELGLIAEEVAEVYPEFVQYDENGEPIGVNYSRLTAALIGAVKELTNQVQELNKKING
jgi:hypothetical protein